MEIQYTHATQLHIETQKVSVLMNSLGEENKTFLQETLLTLEPLKQQNILNQLQLIDINNLTKDEVIISVASILEDIRIHKSA
jgi:hypothetical protein